MRRSTTSRPNIGRNFDSEGSMQVNVLDITTETRHLDGVVRPMLAVSGLLAAVAVSTSAVAGVSDVSISRARV